MATNPPLDLDFDLLKHMEVGTVIEMVLENSASRCLDDSYDRKVVTESLAHVIECWTSYRAAIAAFKMGAELTSDEILETMAAIESGYAHEATDKEES